MFDRAQRRHEKDRMKAKARRVFPTWPAAEHNADNLKACGRRCCNNPRKHGAGMTFQERRKLQEQE